MPACTYHKPPRPSQPISCLCPPVVPPALPCVGALCYPFSMWENRFNFLVPASDYFPDALCMNHMSSDNEDLTSPQNMLGFILLLLGVTSALKQGWINLFLTKSSKYYVPNSSWSLLMKSSLENTSHDYANNVWMFSLVKGLTEKM